MKILSIVSSRTSPGQTVFRTDPILSQEVFAHALKNYFEEQHADMFDVSLDGLFIVRRTSIPKEEIERYNTALSNAEKAINEKQEAAKKNHRNFLERRSEETGLPLE
jgi:hypothetical protein